MHREIIKALLGLPPDCLSDPETRTMFVAWQEELVTLIEATLRGETIPSDQTTATRELAFDTLVGTTLRDLMRTALRHKGL